MIRWARDKAPSNATLDEALEKLLPDTEPGLIKQIHRAASEVARVMTEQSRALSLRLFTSRKVQPDDGRCVDDDISMSSSHGSGSKWGRHGSGSGSRQQSLLGRYLSSISLRHSHRPRRVHPEGDGLEGPPSSQGSTSSMPVEGTPILSSETTARTQSWGRMLQRSRSRLGNENGSDRKADAEAEMESAVQQLMSQNGGLAGMTSIDDSVKQDSLSVLQVRNCIRPRGTHRGTYRFLPLIVYFMFTP